MTSMTSSARPLRCLVIGASYGLLPAAKIAAAGHSVTVIGHKDQIRMINQAGVAIRYFDKHVLHPPMGADGLCLSTIDSVDPTDFDLVILAIQEPQAASEGISALFQRIGDRVPVASIMNMPPPPFLDRIPALPREMRQGAYQNHDIWAQLDPDRMTLASPDPQAVCLDPARPGHLQVTLASNFKFAPFSRIEDQTVLERIVRDATRARQPWGRPPVHMLARRSIFTPLSKWPMLVTGNCRCVQEVAAPISIKDAVYQNLHESRLLFDAVNFCLRGVGAPRESLVLFKNYCNAANQLTRPSSLGQGLMNGAKNVERIDRLVLNLMRFSKCDPAAIDAMVHISARIEQNLVKNRCQS